MEEDIFNDMMHTEKGHLNAASSSSEENLCLESRPNDSDIPIPTTVTDDNPLTLKYKRHLLHVEKVSKKHKANSEASSSEMPSTSVEKVDQVSEMGENSSISIYKDSLHEIIDSTNLNESEKSKKNILYSYVFESMLPKNNIFVREVVYLSKCILYSENLGCASTRNKPLGCKTVLVTGLPQKITKEIIKEIFERCGSLEAIKMSEKDFCYITFSEELSVNRAICFSGYRLKIENKDDPLYTGILHVDYSANKFDQVYLKYPEDESDCTLPVSPCTHYFKYDSKILREKLQNENTFYDALCEVIEWLKDKKSSKIKSFNLYSLMHYIYIHVMYLVNKKGKIEVDVTKLKSDLVKHVEETCKVIVVVENAFKLLQEKKIWCFFTNIQKKYVTMWEKFINQWKVLLIEELFSYGIDFKESHVQSKKSMDLQKENNSEYHKEDSEPQNEKYFCGPSTPSLEHYTDSAASFIYEKLKREKTFLQAANIVLTWLENEECTVKNAKSFFSMMQCIHNHVEKLQSNRNEYQEESKTAKGTLIKYLKEIIDNVTEIEKIYSVVSTEKFSNHFNVIEKKIIELWKKIAEEFRLNVEKNVNELKEKIIENKKNVKYIKGLNNDLSEIVESHTYLKYHSKELQNNIKIMQSDHKKDFQRLDDQLAVLRKDIKELQNNILKVKKQRLINAVEIRELHQFFLSM